MNMNEGYNLGMYLDAINRSNLSDADKALLVELRWTEAEIGEITSSEEYEAFGRAQATIEADARGQGIPLGSMNGASPEMMQRYIEWTRTPAGIMWTMLGGARLGWEEDHE